MADPEDETNPPSPKRAARQERQDRLAAQLRANLRRRKAQSRTRAEGRKAAPPSEKPGQE